MSTRVLINATILNNPRLTGLGVYTAAVLPRLVKELESMDGVEELVLLGDSARITAVDRSIFTSAKVRVREVATNSPVKRLIALNRAVSAEIGSGARILYYSPTHHGVLTRKVRQVITVHDLFARLFPSNYRLQSWYFRLYLPRVLAVARRVIVDSSATGEDLQRFYPQAPPSQVALLGVREDLADSPAEVVSRLADRPFFLFVGPSFPYKNCERLLDAFARLCEEDPEVALVFAGGRKAYVDRLKRCASGLGFDPFRLAFLDYVPMPQLVWLYRHAEALLITTLYEGFGLPALEAMQCGCPVIASRRGSLPEVCGSAAWFVDPEKVDEIRNGMKQMRTDRHMRDALIVAGRANVPRFGWDTTAAVILKVLQEYID